MSTPARRPTRPSTAVSTPTEELLALLRRHYLKPGAQPGGIFAHEVGWNHGGLQRCDAIYVGFTSASGRQMIGHEVKVSRADWLAELAKPGKADAWADQCHQWWLVTLPDVIRPGELPAGWGHMVPGVSKTRMQVLTPAAVHADRQPSWDAVRSVMARDDTLRQSDALRVRKDVEAKARADAAAQVEGMVARRVAYDTEQAAEAVARLAQVEAALGFRIVDEAWHRQDHLALQDLAAIARAAKARGDVRRATDALLARHHDPLAQVRRALERLDAALGSLPEASPEDPQVLVEAPVADVGAGGMGTAA